MTTKIVYVVVSNNSDTYIEQAIVSAFSVRKHNPDAFIEIVTDAITMHDIPDEQQYFKTFFDRVTIIETPAELTQMQRSRYLKTKLRNLISGDYLFIDTDTVICGALDEIDNIESDLGAVRENNYHYTFDGKSNLTNRLAEKAGVISELIGEPYFNSGVMYVKDTPRAHALYDRWHDCWLKTKEKGVDTDQTALCWANKLEGHYIKHIDDKWNCFVRLLGINYLDSAKIIHYLWGRGDGFYPISFKSVFTSIKKYRDIPPFVEYYIDNPKLLLVDYEDVITLNKLRAFKNVQNAYPKFFAFWESVCKAYYKTRNNWLNVNFFKIINKKIHNL